MSDKYKELIAKYPKLFAIDDDKPSPYSERGIACGEGWYDLLDTLCARVQEYTDQTSQPVQPLVQQIKEKFGTLSFYISGYNDYVRGLISMAESMSAHICEECGEKGTRQPNMSWIKTLCHNCYHEWDNIREAKWGNIKKPLDAAIEGVEEACADEVELYKTYGGE